jgi:hypothetical protein
VNREQDLNDLLRRLRLGEPGARAEFGELFSRGISLLLAREFEADEVQGNVEGILDAVARDLRADATVTGETMAGAVRVRLREEVSELRETLRARNRGAAGAEAACREALVRLSREQKDLLRRHYILDQPRQQICAEMHIGEPEFRSLKAGARDLFASALRPKPVERYPGRLALRQTAG